jgi:hypothetical protein
MDRRKWYAAIGRCKQNFNVAQTFSGQPPQFVDILNYIKSIKFDNKPDYNWI